LAIQIGRVLTRSYKNALDWKALCVIPGRLVWAIYVEALFLDFEGNAYDAVSIATWAALQNTMLPRISLQDGEVEVTDDPQDCVALDLSNVPVTVTLTKVCGLSVFSFLLISLSTRTSMVLEIGSSFCHFQ